jgi:hypothetical protein
MVITPVWQPHAIGFTGGRFGREPVRGNLPEIKHSTEQIKDQAEVARQNDQGSIVDLKDNCT